MRLRMDNHFSSNSVIAEIDNKSDDIEFVISKRKTFISKNIYYRIEIRSKNNNLKIHLNKEQLLNLHLNLIDYIATSNYQKRTDSKASKLESIL